MKIEARGIGDSRIHLLNQIELDYFQCRLLNRDESHFTWVYYQHHRFLDSNRDNRFTVMVF